MTLLLPPRFDRVTHITIAVPIPTAPDLQGPDRRAVIPERVEITLRRTETGPDVREWAHVAVIGPRRLRSGAAGRHISVTGWERALNRGPHGHVHRPVWLTLTLRQQLPDGWHSAVLDLAGVTP
ncbi:hypothetical protein [Streptomyces sp. t39]|uniref:hypothetical protein n=1 Tax=Streptomyces sp. t39 TaxID=1828156 RepID=UPI0011CDE16B|nr:hypothetical protein [Streptomyces sp. t39]TXS55227.1 hypothetical protein EAO77_02700 [Streptomyces sp. t39]